MMIANVKGLVDLQGEGMERGKDGCVCMYVCMDGGRAGGVEGGKAGETEGLKK